MNEKDILDVLDVGNLSLREAWTLESLKKELQKSAHFGVAKLLHFCFFPPVPLTKII